MKKVVIPLSGGCDSAVLLFKAMADTNVSEVHCIVFDYGQRHRQELVCARSLFKRANELFTKQSSIKEVNVQAIKDLAPTSSLTNDNIATPDIRKIAGEAQPKSYVAFRNMIFLSLALSHAEAVGAVEVWHGATAVDSLSGYWDCDESFLTAMNQVAILNREHKIEIVAPLIKSDKVAIIKQGVELRVPFAQTYTCYSGEELADATTPSSSLRLQGFIGNKLQDPIRYKQQEYLDKVYLQNGCKPLPY